MTPELAERVLSRRPKDKPGLSDAQTLEVLMDWLEGMTWPEIMAKHKAAKSSVARVIHQAKKQARAVLERKL